MNVSGGETIQTRVSTFLNQHGSSKSMHYIADTQEQPSTDVTFVSEEVLKLKKSAAETCCLNSIGLEWNRGNQ